MTMKIIIEGYQYAEQAVAGVLKGFEPSTLDGRTSVNHVGYCYSRELGDCIFFLPKVLIDSDRGCVLWHPGLKPEDIIDFGEALRQHRVSRADYAFLSGFAVWIYRAIREFGRLHPCSGTLLSRSFSRLDGSHGTACGTLLDVVLSLVRFGRDHRDFFITAMKASRSGFSKIDWRKTVARTPAVMRRGVPVYPRPAVRRRQTDFDEELMVVYASIMAHIARRYGFRADVPCGYEPMSVASFSRYLGGYGQRRLRQIKYRYFSDTALELWRLCYAFFGEVERVRSSRQDSDYLLVRNFNVVFEAIIDELIGDDKGGIDPDLKDQPDGKVVDHIYRYPSLVGGDDIYYIGDSKYYKIGAALGANSVYKQYTYAKNVIQLNINWYFDSLRGTARHPKVRYRDALTEGYNITPNFFISARVSPGAPTYAQPCLIRRPDHSGRVPCCQFSNRLFDRDTLWLQHYDVNFLYVIALYARSNYAEKQRFKALARSEFKQGMLQMLSSGADGYDFYIAEPRLGHTLEQAVTANFRTIIGKVFRPDDSLNAVVLALRRGAADNAAVLSQMRADFIVHGGYRLGDDISEFLHQRHQFEQPYEHLLNAASPATSYHQPSADIPHPIAEKPTIKPYKRTAHRKKT